MELNSGLKNRNTNPNKSSFEYNPQDSSENIKKLLTTFNLPKVPNLGINLLTICLMFQISPYMTLLLENVKKILYNSKCLLCNTSGWSALSSN